MSSEEPAAVYGTFAEEITSARYRQALNTEYDSDPEAYRTTQTTAEEIIFDGIRTLRQQPELRAWEARRQFALKEAYGTKLGAFNDYVQAQGGQAQQSELQASDIGEGQAEIVRVNSMIKGLNTIHTEPIDFLVEALDTIDCNRTGYRYGVGPENYATSLKFFADKFDVFPSSHLSKSAVHEVITRTMEGFLAVTAEDKPNFIEMTNLYYTIRSLPKGSFDSKFTHRILVLSLEQLPDYNDRTISLLFASIAKLDYQSVESELPAITLDLAMRKGQVFSRTRDMRQALRALAVIPACAAANQTFETFLELRNNLEEPLDIEGIDDINENLAKVVEKP